MPVITDEMIENVYTAVGALSSSQAETLTARMEKEQPGMYEYAMGSAPEVLNDTEREELLFHIFILYRLFGAAGLKTTISEETLDAAEKSMVDRIEASEDEDFLFNLMDTHPQKAMLELFYTILFNEEEDNQIREDSANAIYLTLLIIIDAFDLTTAEG